MRAHLSRPGVLVSLVATALALGAPLQTPLHAQTSDAGRASLVVPTAGTGITANERFVYVLVGTKVFQLDASSLQVIRSVELEPPPEQFEDFPEEESTQEEVVTEEVVVEEPILDDGPLETDPVTRRAAGRQRIAARGDRASAAAIESALKWLVAHQSEDGSWDCDGFMAHDLEGEAADGPGSPVHDVGVTGLALLALMGDGNTLRSGPHREAVKKGIAWLREQQDPRSGLIGGNNSHEFIYDHAIAALAIVEAYGLSDSNLLKQNAQRALNYLEYHRNPYAVWRYQPRDGDNDTSVTAWCTMAWKAGKDFGLEVNNQTGLLVAAWIDQMTDPVSGRTGYVERGGLSARMPGDHANRFPREANEAMTAAGLFVEYLVGKNPETTPIMAAQADLILHQPPTWEPNAGKVDFVAWFFGSHALFQYGGRHWDNWRRSLTPTLVKHQRRDGNFAGSWDPCGPWGESMGRLGSTALGTLALESAYRYSRLIGD